MPLVPDETARQLEDYRKQLVDWTATIGKNPEKAEGYTDETGFMNRSR